MTDRLATRRRLRFALLLTSAYLGAELVGAWWSGSLALLADAGHMLTDVGGLGLSLYAAHLADQPATARHTYGWYRAEILATLANATVLLVMSGVILQEAYTRLTSPPVVQSGLMLIVAAVGLFVNLASAFILRAGARSGLNEKAAYLEVMSDLLSSAAVIVAAAIMWRTHWYLIDPIISAGIGLLILPRTWALIQEAVGVLLEGTPPDVDLSRVRAEIQQVPAVIDVHDLHVWSITSGLYALSVHVVRAADAAAEDVLRGVQALVQSSFPISHVTIQVEPPGWLEGGTHL